MALNGNAVLTAAVGYILTAPVGTAAPTAAQIGTFDPVAGLTDWEQVGHTARDELPVFGYEGGETETRGTWQAAVIKTVMTEPASDYVTFNVHQFDDSNLGLYYGSDNQSDAEGTFSVSSTAGATERALLIVIVDGNTRLAFHAEKVEIRREDSIELAVDEFAYMPLRATIVQHDASTVMFSWVSPNTGLNPDFAAA